MTKWFAPISAAMLALLLRATPAFAATDPHAVDFFETRIRPVLVENCYSCHSASAPKLKAGLRLDTRDGMLHGGESGPAVVPGKLDDSLLVSAIHYEEGGLQMPPKGKLKPQQISDLETWVSMGAPYPDDPSPASPTTAPTHLHGMSLAEGRKFWSFQKPRERTVPHSTSNWPHNEIDQFILAKQNEAGLTPSPQADKRTLIRRATYDLIGLPPTMREIQDFENDTSPGAFAKVVDRLLASPHYGERWGRYWLDIARYADNKGYVFKEDRDYHFAYTYRDWVIRAFNDDLPYDQFLIQQIAADKIERKGDNHPLAALGFLTLGRRFLNSQPDIIDDRIDVVCRGTMALTVECARCHDHKYDPIPQADYYSLYGVFASSTEPDPPPLNAPTTQPMAFEDSPDDQPTVDSDTPPRAMAMEDLPTPVEPHIFKRGNASNPGDPVPRQFPAILSPDDRKPFTHGSGRLELARDIASRDNPLTARVMVNRVWQYHFGFGLVRSTSDFGTRGEKPSHPELLDWLTLRFENEDGWSIKKLHRRIMLSAAYQQASLDDNPVAAAKDPENRLLWRQNPRRLDFEAMRDSLLFASGQMDLNIGGPSVDILAQPFIPRRTIYAYIDRQNLPGTFRTFDFASPDSTNSRRFITSVPQQALFMMNSPFVIQQAKDLSQRAEIVRETDPAKRVASLYRTVLGRTPTPNETTIAVNFIRNENDSKTAWQQYAQVLLESNEFAFVD